MPVPRRRLLQSLATAAALGPTAPAQQPAPQSPPQPTAASVPLAPERLRLLEPLLERRRTQLQPLRDFELADAIAPLRGPLLP